MGANSMTKAGEGAPPSGAAQGEPDLLRRIASADIGAIELLYDSYGSLAYGVALRITFDEASAQDVVQDAFISVWRHAARFDPARGSVKTWLLAIVHHRAIDEVRRRRGLQGLPDMEDDLPAPLTMADVWGEVAERLDARSVRQAFAELPEPQQEALRLAYYEGLTQEEIASKTGTPLGTVKSRTRLGLLSLRRRLGDGDGDGHGDGDGQSAGRRGLGRDVPGTPAQAVE
jgi:RNA polymerase sigma-70 factor (ECF subfamily)